MSSHELSQKVFAGQSRLIELGYRQGGAPGFGLVTMDMVVVGETTLFGVSDFALTAAGSEMVAQRSMLFAKN